MSGAVMRFCSLQQLRVRFSSLVSHDLQRFGCSESSFVTLQQRRGGRSASQEWSFALGKSKKEIGNARRIPTSSASNSASISTFLKPTLVPLPSALASLDRVRFSSHLGSSLHIGTVSFLSLDHLHPSRFQMKQKREYLYLPTTWADLKERLKQWWIEAEARTIRVRLLRKNASLPPNAPSVDELYRQSLQQAEKKYTKRRKVYRQTKVQAKRAVQQKTRQYRDQLNQFRARLGSAALDSAKIPTALKNSGTAFKMYRQMRRIERQRQWNRWMLRIRNQQLLARKGRPSDASPAVTASSAFAQLEETPAKFATGGEKAASVESYSSAFRSSFSEPLRRITGNSTAEFANARRSELRTLQSNIGNQMGRYYKDTSWRVAWRYRRWKTRRQEQWRRLKKRMGTEDENLQDDKDADGSPLLTTHSLTLTEYSQPEWFDELGRPLTSRDATGRFVNPWMSQSTNGIQPLTSILAWRWLRIKRNIQQDGLIGSLIPRLSWNRAIGSGGVASEADQKIATEPLPPMFKDAVFQGDDFTSDETVAAIQFTWIGHSTSWIQMNGYSILTDPIFSLRASPYQAIPIGVPRDVPPSHTVADLAYHAQTACSHRSIFPSGEPSIDLCCITHDHYDHMDKNSVWDLRDHVKLWIVPLGIQEWLEYQCQIPPERIIELEWWEQVRLRKLEGRDGIAVVGKSSALENKHGNESIVEPTRDIVITCCPAQHWASRTMMDRNQRLWCSFAIESSRMIPQSAGGSTTNFRLFFCGDTGYPQFPLFRQIGDALGPFDLSAIPIGAYEPKYINKEAHVGPAEAIQIHHRLRSQRSVGIHWGTFALSEEALDAPPRLLEEVVNAENNADEKVDFTTISFGQTIEIPHKR